MHEKTIRELFGFLRKSPTAFHAVDNISQLLDRQGFHRLLEGQKWEINPGGRYYVTRNNTSIIAVKIGTELDQYSFTVTASHSDSPAFKIKENAEIAVGSNYTKLNTEGYGGMICSTWLDRPLSVAGRVIVREKERYITKLVNIDRNLLMIPNMAIHMNRRVNEECAYNKQVDMLPVFCGEAWEKGKLKALVAEELAVCPEDIYGMDLFLYNRMEPTVWGAEQEFIASPRLDDLECAYASLQGFLAGSNEHTIQVCGCFDNEEVGSCTRQGAGSTFLPDVLYRIHRGLGKTGEEYCQALAGSFMLSCDNAHAVHPNHTEKSDVTNGVYMNGGIVVKSHAGQKYTSDAVSIAAFRGICEKAGVPVQFFANRSDMAGGSTLGNIAMTQVSMNCIDIGLAQLAMHSSYEIAGAKDCQYMIQAVTEFYNCYFEEKESRVLEVRR